jgi:hypothetical protein
MNRDAFGLKSFQDADVHDSAGKSAPKGKANRGSFRGWKGLWDRGKAASKGANRAHDFAQTLQG